MEKVREGGRERGKALVFLPHHSPSRKKATRALGGRQEGSWGGRGRGREGGREGGRRCAVRDAAGMMRRGRKGEREKRRKGRLPDDTQAPERAVVVGRKVTFWDAKAEGEATHEPVAEPHHGLREGGREGGREGWAQHCHIKGGDERRERGREGGDVPPHRSSQTYAGSRVVAVHLARGCGHQSQRGA